jgi:K+-transporting ATPase A subunit
MLAARVFKNPMPLSNFIDLLAIVLAPAALTRFLAGAGRIRRGRMSPRAPEGGEARH